MTRRYHVVFDRVTVLKKSRVFEAPDTSRQTKIGLIGCLGDMVVEPFRYTYSSDAADEETPEDPGGPEEK